MRFADKIQALFGKAQVTIEPARDEAVFETIKTAYTQTAKDLAEPRIWRWIMTNSTTKLATAALVVLGAALGLGLLNRSTRPVYGMPDALELMARAKTMHIKGWSLSTDDESGEPVKQPFEEWYDFENGRYRSSSTLQIVCDGQYVMCESRWRRKGGPWHNVVDFEKVDPNDKRQAAVLNWQKELRRVEGFEKVGRDVIEGWHYDIWQGEYGLGTGDDARRMRLQTWLSPDTGDVGRTRHLQEQDGQWVIQYERTRIERDVPLPAGIFVTEPRGGFEIRTPKEDAVVRPPLDVYKYTQYDYAPLAYRIREVFALPGGCLLACWQGVDNLESRDQSKYFQHLQIGGDLPKLPVEVFAFSPEPNVRDITFVGFHLAHTEKETEPGRRWYEWSLFVPDKEPPAPEAVFNYRVHYRLNIDRTDHNDIDAKQLAIRDPRMIATEGDFNTHVLGAMAQRSDDGAIPAHVTYSDVLDLAERLRGSIAP